MLIISGCCAGPYYCTKYCILLNHILCDISDNVAGADTERLVKDFRQAWDLTRNKLQHHSKSK